MTWQEELRSLGASDEALEYYERLCERYAGQTWTDLRPDGTSHTSTVGDSFANAAAQRAPWPEDNDGCMCWECHSRQRRRREDLRQWAKEREDRERAEAIALLNEHADLKVRPAAVSDLKHTDKLLKAYFTAAAPGSRHVAKRGPRQATQALMDDVLEVLSDFESTMSTRQVYYQLISRGAAENSDRSYERVQRLLVQMRRDGHVPYDRIVDRNRSRHVLAGWEGARDLLDQGLRQYRRDKWAEQRTVVMVACEKAALEGIFTEAVDEYGAQLWTIRGFNSESFAYEWAEEIKRLTKTGKRVVVGYFGDFDPSGLAIEQDAKDKLSRHGARFEWQRHGLLVGDFEAFDLVSVPVKPGDSRSRRYVETFGESGAELDALNPDELMERVRSCVVEHIDEDVWENVERMEAVERESFESVVRNWDAALAAARVAA